MREILFRGKRVDNGEWVYGYYCPVVRGKFPATPCIVPDCDGVWEGVPIIPETVGQYTGLKDKNGNKIFEGDILRNNITRECHVVRYDSNGDFAGAYTFHNLSLCDWNLRSFSIAGNIHDNPELLEVK